MARHVDLAVEFSGVFRSFDGKVVRELLALEDKLHAVHVARQVPRHLHADVLAVEGFRLAHCLARTLRHLLPRALLLPVDLLRRLVAIEQSPRVGDHLGLGIHDPTVDELGTETKLAVEVLVDRAFVHLDRAFGVLRAVYALVDGDAPRTAPRVVLRRTCG